MGIAGVGAEFARHGGSAVQSLCLALFASTFLSRFQCSGATKGSWRRRVERREPLEITLPKLVWFHTDAKIILILEENGAPRFCSNFPKVTQLITSRNPFQALLYQKP